MARRMWDDTVTLYRAVVTITWDDGDASVRYLGPFTSQGAATAALKRTKRSYDGGYEWWIGRDTKDGTIEGFIESATPVWQPIQ